MIAYQRLKPRASLSHLFDLIEVFDVPKEDTPIRCRLLPDDRRYLCFCCGSAFSYEILGVNVRFSKHFFFSGVSPYYAKCSLKGELSMINFRLAPCSIFRLTNKNASLYANKLIGFEELAEADSSPLIRELLSTKDHHKRIMLIEDFLESIPLCHPSPRDEKFKQLLLRIIAQQGRINVQQLLIEHAMSYTYLERLFKHYIGISPKKYCKLLQIKNIIKISEQNPSMRFIDLALEQGFYDQAHFNKDFKQFTGLSPNSFYRTEKLLGDAFVLMD